MKPQQAQPPPVSPQEPPPPWWHLHRWAPVHLAVLGVSLFVLLGVVIARVDVYEWRRHHVPQSDYETFQYPCQARRATRSAGPRLHPAVRLTFSFLSTQAANQRLLLYCWPDAPLDVRIAGTCRPTHSGARALPLFSAAGGFTQETPCPPVA